MSPEQPDFVIDGNRGDERDVKSNAA
jgi:hypothetical protein